MKNNRTYMDIGSILDEVFESAKDFGAKMGKEFGAPPPPDGFSQHWNETEGADYYPSYSYPPMNIYLTPERSIVFEFALAGFEESNLSLIFQGDYMVFSARIGVEEQPEDNSRYIKRRLKLKDVERQKYYVPADKFEQEKVKAVFRNGILTVTIPALDVAETEGAVKIEIVKEGN